jgi:hypothetical protein
VNFAKADGAGVGKFALTTGSPMRVTAGLKKKLSDFSQL